MKPKYHRFKHWAYKLLTERGPMSGHDLCFEVQLINRNVSLQKQALPWLLGNDERFIVYKERNISMYDVKRE